MASAASAALAALVAELLESPSNSSIQFKLVLDLANQDPVSLLQELPKVAGNPEKALVLLSLLLEQEAVQWPVLDLLRCYSALRKGMPEAVRSGKAPEVTRVMEDVVDQIHKRYKSLSDLMEDSDRPALIHPEERTPITHRALKRSVQNFRLPLPKGGKKNPVVAIAVPNGPLLAATCLSVAAHFAMAPINPAVGREQFRVDVEQVQASIIVTTPDTSAKLGLTDSWLYDRGIIVFHVDFSPSQELALSYQNGDPLPTHELPSQPNKGSDICLQLFTSGTSGKKKIVPLTLHLVMVGAMFVIDSWGLSPSDICLNMMPLFHVGGLLRNTFAPILAGGSTVCCAAFDPSLFWSVVERIGPTWYYASPTMHNLILLSAPSSYNSRFRLVCNAAGGLLPSLAVQLQDIFNCTVLPSYGMTECMPISTPPLTYMLDRAGTSGIETGPELAILDLNDHYAAPNEVGRICVRGEPVFKGYLQANGDIDRSAFNEDGWFDTGDMGYMDNDGYLYVTGRSKEVINRGGEIISPFEVENAIMNSTKQTSSPIFGRVNETLAFSVKHNILQEVVGVVLVTSLGKPRPDLRALQDALQESLQKAKWPSVIVYMDALPKANNKVLRINVAERASLPTYTDDTPFLERHWEGICPPENTPLSVKIKARQCQVDEDFIASSIKKGIPWAEQLDTHIRRNEEQGTVEVVVAPAAANLSPIPAKDELEAALAPRMVAQLDNYLIPHRLHVLPEPLPRLRRAPAVVDVRAIEAIIRNLEQEGAHKLQSTIEGRVVAKFAEILQCDPSQVWSDADFFALGGDSLRAGKLIALLRSEFRVAVPISVVFNDSTPKAIAKFIEENLPEETGDKAGEKQPSGCEETYSSTRWSLLLLQLVPMVCVYPARRAFQWTVFMVALTFTHTWPTAYHVLGRLNGLVLSILFAQFISRLIMPWIGLLAKWTIIGRYREGLYPMWGSYHTRWWLVQKITDVCGYGWFGWSNYTRILYYRMMGAKIGENVSIARVKIGEWDLVEVCDGAILEGCTCRPFAAEWNTTMYLGKIVVGRNSTVGVASILAPGTEVPENTCIGPNSSTWELQSASESNRDLLSAKRPKSHWALVLFITLPLMFLKWLVSLGPWIAGLIGLVIEAPRNSNNPFFSILTWFAGPRRVGYHYFALILRAAFTPFIGFAFTLVVKWILDRHFGELGPSPVKGRSQVTTWRMDLMRMLMPPKKLHDMTEMFGQHYEATSIALRLLGAKIGKRVYWPGSGPAISDYHLVNISNDVVFGSRSHIVTSDAIGAEPVTVNNNSMIADRAVLLPGVEIGSGTIMGSGALTRRNKLYNSGGTFVGSKNGDAVCLNSGAKSFGPEPPSPMSEWDSRATTPTSSLNLITMEKDNFSANAKTIDFRDANEMESSSPFGRAFYYKLAPYRVLGPFAIFCYSSFLTVVTQFYWNVPSISSIQITNITVKTLLLNENASPFQVSHWYDPLILWGWMTIFIACLTTIQAVVAVAVVISSKWALLGHRQPGNYDWDKSSYCQRWQIFLGIERLRRACYRGHGILGMLTSTHWIVLYFRAMGANIGKDCSLFANGDPSLYFTEPDLLTLGDRVAVDDASLVGHVNTRGKFDLNKLEVGDRCVLRTGSRLLSGAKMEKDACLMEHTLIMSGDVVNELETMQGWPAGVFKGNKVKYGIRCN